MMQMTRRFGRHLGRTARPAFAIRVARKGFKTAQLAATARTVAHDEAFEGATAYLDDTLAMFQQWTDEALTAGFDDYTGFDQNYPAFEL